MKSCEFITEAVGSGYPFNPDDPKNWAKKKAYDNRMQMKAYADQFKKVPAAPQPAKPKLTLDTIWRKVEDVVGQVFPDGDPIDWLIPWFKKHGIEDFKVGDLITRAAKKHGYKDMYDYWDEMKQMYSGDLSEGKVKQFNWTDYDGIGMKERLEIVETYFTSNTNLFESNDKKTADYFSSLSAMSSPLAKNKKYITAVLGMVNNKVMQLQYPAIVTLLEKNGNMFRVRLSDGRETEFPNKHISDKLVAVTFFFDNTNSYDKFRNIMSLKYNFELAGPDEIQGIKELSVAESQLSELGYADKLDTSNYSSDNLLKIGKVIGKIEGNEVMLALTGSEKVYFLVVDGKPSAFLGFKNDHLKNIKNFTQAAGVVRALLGFLVHVKGKKITISPDEPMTSEGIKWLLHLIKSPRGLTIKDQNGNQVDSSSLKQEWIKSRESGEPGSTGIVISENMVFGDKLRENEISRKSKSLLMPVNFYNIQLSDKKGLVEESEPKPKIRKYTDKFGKTWYEVLDKNGMRVRGQGTSGFDDLKNAKSLLRTLLDENLKTDNPCWKGYSPVGTKKKNGKTVPNCVPMKKESSIVKGLQNEGGNKYPNEV